MERLHAGWLIKSPPGKKTIGPWRLFKSKWRERYFVLYAPPSSQTIPGCCSAVLCYYDDENLIKEYGRIDLSRCEEILTQLESDEHRHIFALRTVNKDSERTYYLAANSEDEMNQWANCLCCVLRLSGGDGFNLSSGFDQMFQYGDNLINPSRCSILTQRTGEQRRMSNVPDTISKSALALNIRVAEATPPSPQNASSSTTTPGQKSSHGRMGKRQSILNMVVKPASNTLRRPSCPAIAVNAAQNKFQTVGRSAGLQFTNAQSFLNNTVPIPDFHHQSLTIGRQIPKMNFEPPTPSYGTTPKLPDFGFSSGADQNDNRWRFGEAASTPINTIGSQGPPMLPSRVARSPSAAQTKPTVQQHPHHYRNSSEDWHQWMKNRTRNSDLISEDSDEGSFDPDYVLPKPIYDNDDNNNNDNNDNSNGNNEAGFEYSLQTEAPEEDREDDYSYPPFHYNLMSSSTGEFQSSPSLIPGAPGTDEGELCEDSYDYLPGCSSSSKAPSDRMSTNRSSTHTNNSDNQLFASQDGLYDILPLRNYGSSSGEAPDNNNRMSGVESSDRGSIYQNDLLRLPSTDDSPQSPRETFDHQFNILPLLPDKRGFKEEGARGERRTVPLPPSLPQPPAAHVPDRGPCYINNMTVMKVQEDRSNSVDDEDVYLPMNKSRVSDSTVYTPMHSPEVLRQTTPAEAATTCKEDRVGHLPSSPRGVQLPETTSSDQTPASGSLVPIRFTANTRSFKRKTPPSRTSLNVRVEIPTAFKQKENLEPSSGVSAPPPIPPKKTACKDLNYIHYASLNLDDSIDEKLPSPLSTEPSSSLGGAGGFQSDTLYRLIDPEKTKALCELKKQTDDRQRNFAKFAPEH